ncbi:MAG: helix-turn-helix transcriptional regulator [Planctomycetes bacterium]|nr:helix-turn-helix transcriptional regulator [Planctomycetota bacterium]
MHVAEDFSQMWPTVLHAARSRGTAAPAAGPGRAVVHEHHVVWYHAHGRGWYRCGSEVIEPLIPHLGVLVAGEVDQSCLRGTYDARYAIIDTRLLSQGAAGLVRLALDGATLERSHVRALDVREAAIAARAFAALDDALATPALSGSLRAGAIIGELLALWSTDLIAGAPGRALRVFQALIEEHAEDPDVSLAELARRAGGHPDHLAARFRQQTGWTPVAYRMRVRLDRACALLVDSGLDVAAVARRVGFRDRVHFTRCFRRRFGCTPSDYARYGGVRSP